MSSKMPFNETHGERLTRKAKEAPFVPIGLAGCAIACAYGAYSFKHRGGMSPSVFLMQLRVTAQAAVVSCMIAGLAYNMAQEYIFHPKQQSNDDIKKT